MISRPQSEGIRQKYAIAYTPERPASDPKIFEHELLGIG
jgi:hypothetical protein